MTEHVKIPVLSQTEFYYGHNWTETVMGKWNPDKGWYDTTEIKHYAYKKPDVSGFDPDIMTVLSGGTVNGNGVNVTPHWEIDEYSITFSLIDPDSYIWINDNGEEIEEKTVTLKWHIKREIILFPKPKFPNEDMPSFEYDGSEKTPEVINDISHKGVSQDCPRGLSSSIDCRRSATDAGVHKIYYTLYKGKGFSDDYDYRWEDDNEGSTDDVVLEWKITPASRTLTVPKLIKSSFDYNGREQHVYTNENGGNLERYDYRHMTVTGTVSGILACFTIDEKPNHDNANEINVSFKKDNNYIYRWADEDGKLLADENGNPIETIKLKWWINPIRIKRPQVSSLAFTYDGNGIFDKKYYKFPTVEEGYLEKYKDIVSMVGEEQYKANDYNIIFS